MSFTFKLYFIKYDAKSMVLSTAFFFFNLSCKYLPKPHWRKCEYTNNLITTRILYLKKVLLWIICRYFFQFCFKCIWCAVSMLGFRLKHYVKSVQIRSFFWFFLLCISLSVFSPNAGKYGPEKTPYLDTFHAVEGHLKTWFTLPSSSYF